MKCPYCGAENNDSAKFCKECGKSIEKTYDFVCPKCGSPVEEKSKFCNNCGLELAWVDADYDRIPVPVKYKDNKVKQAGQQEQRSTPQLIASIVTASLVFISLLIMFIGLFGDVMRSVSAGVELSKNQFTYFFGDAAKNYASSSNSESFKFLKALMVLHHIFYFLMFAAVIGTIIALAIVITFNFIKGKKLFVKPLLIPMIASLAFTAYTIVAYCVFVGDSTYGVQLTIGSGPITVTIGAILGVLALLSSTFYKWPLSKQKILQHSFFGVSMIFLMIGCTFLMNSSISLKEFQESGSLVMAIQTSPTYLIEAALGVIDSGNPSPSYYGSAIMALVFSFLAVASCLLALYLMKKQRILAIVLGVASIPMVIVPSIVVAHDYAFAVVESGETIHFGITSNAIAYAIFIGLFGVSLLTSMIIGKKAPEAEQQKA